MAPFREDDTGEVELGGKKEERESTLKTLQGGFKGCKTFGLEDWRTGGLEDWRTSLGCVMLRSSRSSLVDGCRILQVVSL